MKLNTTSILIIIIIALLGIGFFTYNRMQNKIDESREEVRKSIIKQDSLRYVNGEYRRLVGDTATVKELRDRIRELQLQVEDPIIIEKIVFKPVDTVKLIDSIYINEGIAYIDDYYPNKENYYVRYSNHFSLDNLTGNSEWRWQNIDIDLAISQNEDGTFETTLRAPEFIRINQLEVTALPLTPYKPDNFGILLGAGYGSDFVNGQNYVKVSAGIRYKKTYLEVQGNSNKQADLGVKFEF